MVSLEKQEGIVHTCAFVAKRSHVLKEILDTEKSYVETLDILFDVSIFTLVSNKAFPLNYGVGDSRTIESRGRRGKSYPL